MTEYHLNEAQALLLCMLADSKEAKQADAVRGEIIAVVKAWRRGKLLPRWEAPALSSVLGEFAP